MISNMEKWAKEKSSRFLEKLKWQIFKNRFWSEVAAGDVAGWLRARPQAGAGNEILRNVGFDKSLQRCHLWNLHTSVNFFEFWMRSKCIIDRSLRNTCKNHCSTVLYAFKSNYLYYILWNSTFFCTKTLITYNLQLLYFIISSSIIIFYQ